MMSLSNTQFQNNNNYNVVFTDTGDVLPFCSSLSGMQKN